MTGWPPPGRNPGYVVPDKKGDNVGEDDGIKETEYHEKRKYRGGEAM